MIPYGGYNEGQCEIMAHASIRCPFDIANAEINLTAHEWLGTAGHSSNWKYLGNSRATFDFVPGQETIFDPKSGSWALYDALPIHSIELDMWYSVKPVYQAVTGGSLKLDVNS